MARDDKEGGIVWLMSKLIAQSAMINIGDAINLGRESAFKEIKPEIGAYQWSAILDVKTCPRCKWLDVKYFDADDPVILLISPLLHSGCRCIWVFVLKEELDRFPVSITRLTSSQVLYLTEIKLT